MKRSISKNGIIAVALILMFTGRYFPCPSFLTASQLQLLSLFAGVLLLWMQIAIDWPSVLLLFALALIPELKFATILSSSFGSSTFVFLLFTFTLSYALSKTSLLKRVAYFFLRSRAALRSPWNFVFYYFLSILVIGSFISPTVLFFVYYPLLEEICSLTKTEKGERAASMLMVGTVIMCGISSGMTPIAHVFPLIAMSLYQEATGMVISYFSYMSFALPISLLTALLVFAGFRYCYRNDLTKFVMDKLEENHQEGNLRNEEKIVISVFFLTVFFWVFPSPLAKLWSSTPLGIFFRTLNGFGTALPPLLATVFLCAFPYKGKALLSLKEAFEKGVSWPSLMMCAGTLALGSAMSNTDIGLNVLLSGTLSGALSDFPALPTVFFFCLWAGIQTNLSSNMVTATLVSSALISIGSGWTTLSLPKLIVLVGMMSAYSFATPPAMPCVAVATGSGYCRMKEMAFHGFLAMFYGVILCTILYWLSSFLPF